MAPSGIITEVCSPPGLSNIARMVALTRYFSISAPVSSRQCGQAEVRQFYRHSTTKKKFLFARHLEKGSALAHNYRHAHSSPRRYLEFHDPGFVWRQPTAKNLEVLLSVRKDKKSGALFSTRWLRIVYLNTRLLLDRNLW
jgi:hypothetical protein